MALDSIPEVITVYVTTAGIPTDWLARTSRQLVRDGLAATATVSEYPHPDVGIGARAQLHTRRRHLPAIKSRAMLADTVVAYPLECHDDYRAWILRETAAA